MAEKFNKRRSQVLPPSVEQAVAVGRAQAALEVLPLVVVADPLVGDPLGPDQDGAAPVGSQPIDIAHRHKVEPERFK